MKRLSILGLLILSVMGIAKAQTADSAAILKKIYDVNQSVVTLQAPFEHIRNGMGTSERKGNFYYIAATKQLAMRYSTPEGRYFIFSNNHLHNKIGAVPMHFDTRKSELMRLFGNCMAWAVRGDIQSIYRNNNVDMTVTEDKDEDCYIITMTAQSGFNKGISRIVLKYDRTTCLIFHMEVNEVIHVDHIFRIGRNPQRDHTIDPSHFEI